MKPNISSAQFNAKGGIDCVWDHPRLGKIPFTASPNDPEAHGRAIYQWLVDGEYGEVKEYEPPEIEDSADDSDEGE